LLASTDPPCDEPTAALQLHHAPPQLRLAALWASVTVGL